jgi:hypothetical protein
VLFEWRSVDMKRLFRRAVTAWRRRKNDNYMTFMRQGYEEFWYDGCAFNGLFLHILPDRNDWMTGLS